MLHLMHPIILVIYEVLSRYINLETILFLPLHIRRCNIDLGSHMQEFNDQFRPRLLTSKFFQLGLYKWLLFLNDR